MIEKLLEPIVVNVADGILNGFFPKRKNPSSRRIELLKAYSENFSFLDFLLKNKEYLEKVNEEIKEIDEIISNLPFISQASVYDIPKYFTKENFKKYIVKVAKKNKDIKDLLLSSSLQDWLYNNLYEVVKYILK